MMFIYSLFLCKDVDILNKRIVFIICILLMITLIIFFLQKAYKKLNIGNNISSKSTSDIVDTILNMNSYKANVTVKIKNNRIENTYIIKQENLKNKMFKQEILEPQNIKGTIIKYNGEKLEVKNTKLNLSKMYDKYPYLTENELTLNSFVEDYKSDKESSFIEETNQIILNTKSKISNKYNNYKTLKIDKKTGNPTELEIKDVTQNILVYILYNEIEINSLEEESIAKQ